jgi:hypothetical protein
MPQRTRRGWTFLMDCRGKLRGSLSTALAGSGGGAGEMMGPRDGIAGFLLCGVFCAGVGESHVASMRGIPPWRKVRARMGHPAVA